MVIVNREDRIRTCDPLVPNQVLYQAELLPDDKNATSRSRTCNRLIRSQVLYPIELWMQYTKAEDGVRTRDPHLGKVVFYH